MKKLALLGLGLVACVGIQSSALSYSRTKEPISQACATLGTAAIGAGTWFLTKVATANPTAASVTVGSPRVHVSVGAVLNPLSDGWSMVVATLAACGVGYLGWRWLSSYTAQGYAQAAENIMSGTKCSQPEVLELVQKSAGNADALLELVINHFAAQKNERVKAVSAMEELSNQLSLANHYFDVAKKDFDDEDADLAVAFQEIIEGHLTVLKAASLLVKSHPDYERQSNAETQELAVYAQLATANAIRQAGYAYACSR